MIKNYDPEPGIILALDPSPLGTGWGVVNFDADPKRVIDCGCFDLSQADVSANRAWLLAVQKIRTLIKHHRPEAVVYENVAGTVFGMQGKTTFNDSTALIKMMGCIEYLISFYQIHSKGITPDAWKRFCQIPIGKGTRRDEQKRASIVAAREYYDLLLVNHNIADSLNLLRCYTEKYALSELRQKRFF